MDTQRLLPYAAGAGAVAVVLSALGVSLTALWPLALVLACPLMMLFMMRGMHGGEDHTGHGCEHDSTRARR